MAIGIAIVVVYALMVGVLVVRYDHPNPRRGKISGRGGDFSE